MYRMVIDIGSNTVKYDVFSIEGTAFFPVAHRSATVRLIDRIEEGELSKKGVKMLCQTLSDYKEDAEKLSCEEADAFATACMRRLNDPGKVIEKIRKKTGVNVRLLSGEEEALCSFLGMLLSCPAPERGVMLDMGGGSTEINVFEKGASLYAHSCPFGALSLCDDFEARFFPDESKCRRIARYAESAVPEKAASYPEHTGSAVLVGGTAKAAAKLIAFFYGKAPEGFFGAELFSQVAIKLREDRPGLEEALRALLPGRYDIMAAGLSGFEGIFRRLGVQKVLVCPGGVRVGYLPFITGRRDLIYRKEGEEK